MSRAKLSMKLKLQQNRTHSIDMLLTSSMSQRFVQRTLLLPNNDTQLVPNVGTGAFSTLIKSSLWSTMSLNVSIITPTYTLSLFNHLRQFSTTNMSEATQMIPIVDEQTDSQQPLTTTSISEVCQRWMEPTQATPSQLDVVRLLSQCSSFDELEFLLSTLYHKKWSYPSGDLMSATLTSLLSILSDATKATKEIVAKQSRSNSPTRTAIEHTTAHSSPLTTSPTAVIDRKNVSWNTLKQLHLRFPAATVEKSLSRVTSLFTKNGFALDEVAYNKLLQFTLKYADDVRAMGRQEIEGSDSHFLFLFLSADLDFHEVHKRNARKILGPQFF
jgi:hypothetical protein